jgi:hypothetical protein
MGRMIQATVNGVRGWLAASPRDVYDHHGEIDKIELNMFIQGNEYL